MSVSPPPDGSCFLHGDFYGDDCPECAAKRAQREPCPDCDGEGYTFKHVPDRPGILQVGILHVRRVGCHRCSESGCA